MTWDSATATALPSSDVTNLHLLRHGKVDTGGRRLAYGHSDLELSGVGLEQTEALVRHLQHRLGPIDGILTSDLGRTAHLAARLGETLGVPVEATPALREQSMGHWEGRAWEDLTREDPSATAAYWADYLHTTPPGGESFGAMAERIWSAIRDRWSTLHGGHWILVTHAGPIRAFCSTSLGLPLDQALRWVPRPGSHTHLLVAEAGTCVQCFGALPDRPVRRRHPRPPAIALSGSAGTGKTTLGLELAARLDVPFIEEGMRRRLEDGLEPHTLERDAFRDLIVELWHEQRDAEARARREAGGFVADRSAVDFAAFWLYYQFGWDEEPTRAFLTETLAHQANYDRIVLLPWGGIPYQRDGIRASSPWVQRAYQALLEGLMSREVPAKRVAIMPAIGDLEQRIRWVLDLLEP